MGKDVRRQTLHVDELLHKTEHSSDHRLRGNELHETKEAYLVVIVEDTWTRLTVAKIAKT